MNPIRAALGLPIAVALAMSAPATAASPRQIIAEAAFRTRDKPVALAQLADAENIAAAQLVRDPANREARLLRAMAIGYRAKLKHSRRDALAARAQFEELAAADPRDAEAAGAVGTWHLDAVVDLGGMVAGMAIGAKKPIGLAQMDRAVALGGKRAFYAGLAALLRLAIDPDDARGRSLAQFASTAPAPELLDRQMQSSVIAVLAALKSGEAKRAGKLARQSLPFGRLNR
ncbi:hypothetical protein COO09_00820 [Rhizorhabdus dicambivorans]|uniref:Uncharacterized protein n=2 Tax=Rhizorhabdus dicambivorans TaxID=1850238 RepID=A0A2A4G336_9SPHN|nr:hypothetical protein CMV14_11435 [Rhizorhabdus dicambivorans]PCE44428.1 hypothetical protein COO09_00820 [Rhizorhabdus dicambivorans]